MISHLDISSVLDIWLRTCNEDVMGPNCIDLFAGCGGLSLGLCTAGFTTEFAVEAHTDAFETYRSNLLDNKDRSHNWPEWLAKRAWKAQDILKDHSEELTGLRGKIDLIAGGPPCQGFSMNGLRRPDDPRSRMVEVYLDYVRLIRPRMLMLENVVGFKSMKHRTGGTYSEYVQKELDALGYDTWSEVFKASDWGVPQRRPRFVLIAAFKGSLPGINPVERMRVARKSFLSRRELGPGHTSAMDAISDLEEGILPLEPDSEWGHRGFKSLKRSETASSSYQKLMRAGSESGTSDLRLPRHGEASVRRMKNILETCERGVCLRPDDRERLGIRKRSTTPLDPSAPSPTISTLPDDFVHYSKPRAMTVREHARIQSFPDWFSFKGPYTTGGERRREACPRFTQVGNAVPPLLAEALGETLLALLKIQRHDERAHLPESVDVNRKYTADVREVGNLDIIVPLYCAFLALAQCIARFRNEARGGVRSARCRD